MILTSLFSLTSAQAAELTLGADYTPPGRGDQVWVEEGQSSGTQLGELDGIIRPPLSPWVGWRRERGDIHLGLSTASMLSRDWDASGRHSQALGGLRIELEGQRRLRSIEGLELYGLGGLHATIPWSWERDSSYTSDEQSDADEGAAADRTRVGGLGLQAGLGADYWLAPQLGLGIVSSLLAHRWHERSEESYAASWWLLPETALRLQFRWL